jgi:hypothetical protein
MTFELAESGGSKVRTGSLMDELFSPIKLIAINIKYPFNDID